MRRIFLYTEVVGRGPVVVNRDKARYLSSVLRCVEGEIISVTDLNGNSYLSRIASITRKEVIIEVLERQDIDAESRLHIRLLQGVLKGEKMDLVVQKATELGVKEVVPVVTERSQIRETKKLARWRKIAEEASRQSGRSRVPVIHETMEFADLTNSGLVSGGGIIFWEQCGDNLSALLRRRKGQDEIALFTGPEGGFSELEVRAAAEMGLSPATLGKRILRAETAAITAVAIAQYELGDLCA